MCTTNKYKYQLADGTEGTTSRSVFCDASRGDKACSKHFVFEHSCYSIRDSESLLGTSPGSRQFPPTPTYSPRSGTPNYRSGDESERSRHSTSSSSRHRHRSRRSSRSSYIIGGDVIDLNRHERSPRREHIVLVEGPPTPRTPPTDFNSDFNSDFNFSDSHYLSVSRSQSPSRRSPSRSPSRPSPSQSRSSSVYSSSPQSNSSYSYRPVFVDSHDSDELAERPHVEIKIVDAELPSRRTSTRDRSSPDRRSPDRHSPDSHGRSSNQDKERDEEEERQRRIRLRIAKANAEINKRPPIPLPMTYSSPRASSGAGTNDSVRDLGDDFRRLSFSGGHDEGRFSRPRRRRRGSYDEESSSWAR